VGQYIAKQNENIANVIFILTIYRSLYNVRSLTGKRALSTG
jgi:hypothetical protein